MRMDTPDEPATTSAGKPTASPTVPVLNWSAWLTRLAVFSLLALIGCAVDLWTKHWAFEQSGLQLGEIQWWLEGYAGVQTTVNIGALFGLGAGWGGLFAVFSVVAALAIVTWLFGFQGAASWWLTVAMGCVLGGILGNLYDRLGMWYQPDLPPAWRSGVRDWILLAYEPYSWPNFNIADALLVTGAAMLMIYSLRGPAPTA
jgi:signal peptidase II